MGRNNGNGNASCHFSVFSCGKLSLTCHGEAMWSGLVKVKHKYCNTCKEKLHQKKNNLLPPSHYTGWLLGTPTMENHHSIILPTQIHILSLLSKKTQAGLPIFYAYSLGKFHHPANAIGPLIFHCWYKGLKKRYITPKQITCFLDFLILFRTSLQAFICCTCGAWKIPTLPLHPAKHGDDLGRVAGARTAGWRLCVVPGHF